MAMSRSSRWRALPKGLCVVCHEPLTDNTGVRSFDICGHSWTLGLRYVHRRRACLDVARSLAMLGDPLAIKLSRTSRWRDNDRG